MSSCTQCRDRLHQRAHSGHIPTRGRSELTQATGETLRARKGSNPVCATNRINTLARENRRASHSRSQYLPVVKDGYLVLIDAFDKEPRPKRIMAVYRRGEGSTLGYVHRVGELTIVTKANPAYAPLVLRKTLSFKAW